jgi:hypothetical protein
VSLEVLVVALPPDKLLVVQAVVMLEPAAVQVVMVVMRMALYGPGVVAELVVMLALAVMAAEVIMEPHQQRGTEALAVAVTAVLQVFPATAVGLVAVLVSLAKVQMGRLELVLL